MIQPPLDMRMRKWQEMKAWFSLMARVLDLFYHFKGHLFFFSSFILLKYLLNNAQEKRVIREHFCCPHLILSN